MRSRGKATPIVSNQPHQPPRARTPRSSTNSSLAVLGGLALLGVFGIVLGLRAPSAQEAPPQAQAAPPRTPSEAPRPPEPPRPAPQPAPQPKAADAAPLPVHVIADDASLAPKRGRRFEVRVGELISPADCARLVEKYRDRGGAEGQVSVSVQVTTPKGEKTVTPLCFDNMDGKGTQEGTGRQLIAATKATPVAVTR